MTDAATEPAATGTDFAPSSWPIEQLYTASALSSRCNSLHFLSELGCPPTAQGSVGSCLWAADTYGPSGFQYHRELTPGCLDLFWFGSSNSPCLLSDVGSPEMGTVLCCNDCVLSFLKK